MAVISALKTGRPLLHPIKEFLVLIPVRDLVDPRVLMELEGLGKFKKNPVTGIETLTFRLVV
jgi:hypothetical protein